MQLAAIPQRGRLAAAAALFALVALGATHPTTAHAGLVCSGSIRAGEPDKLGLNDNPVAYRIACSEPITSYSILLDQEVDTFATEVFGQDRMTGAVIGTDAFSCTGDLPGYGINCTGAYGGAFSVLPGTFNLSTTKLCAEPRPDPLLVVTRATVPKNADGTVKPDAKGKAPITTAVAGPFDLGRPRGCPKSTGARKQRIPKSDDTPAESVGDPVSAPVRRRSRP